MERSLGVPLAEHPPDERGPDDADARAKIVTLAPLTDDVQIVAVLLALIGLSSLKLR